MRFGCFLCNHWIIWMWLLLGPGIAGCVLPPAGELDLPSALEPRAPLARDASQSRPAGLAEAAAPPVVVATLDTGVNLFHPDFRRPITANPGAYLTGYPNAANAVDTRLGRGYSADVQASLDELNELRYRDPPSWIPGTNLVALWAHPADAAPVFDVYGAVGNDPEPFHAHGARAASQIAGAQHSLAPGALLAILDTSAQGAYAPDPYTVNAQALRWAADQMWIDIIHTNIQNFFPLAREETAVAGQTPAYMRGYPDAVQYALDRGKLVVAPAGNFYAEPSETSPHAGIPGVLVVGANDNCGFADFSNLNPHIVMDGYGTRAAAANSYGEETFGGTSSSSARAAGYAARLLQEVRAHFADHIVAGGDLVNLEKGKAPGQGPLSDGRLTAAELHRVIRVTAQPDSHASSFDGSSSETCLKSPAATEQSFYPKMGYGEVSEHTLESAVGVLLGRRSMPARPVEDALYDASQDLRRILWDT